MNKPYVLSEELDLSGSYSKETVNFKQLDNFRASLDADLASIGKNTLWVPSRKIRKSIFDALKSNTLPVVSLDDRYVNFAGDYLGVSRGIDSDYNDTGYVARGGYPAIDKQIDTIARSAGEVVLVDDVLFSGEMLEWVIEQLDRRNTKVAAVVCGIAMAEGVDRLNKRGLTVDAGEVFDEVDDEICERDFAIVSGSGRRLSTANANALYFDKSFGSPEKWASIPASAVDEFSNNCIERSANLVTSDVRIEAIGNFVGYAEKGNAREVIMDRLEVRL